MLSFCTKLQKVALVKNGRPLKVNGEDHKKTAPVLCETMKASKPICDERKYSFEVNAGYF